MTRHLPNPHLEQIFLALATVALANCTPAAPADRVRVSGQVEATEVHVAAQVGGRLTELAVAEGTRVDAGSFVARLDTGDAELAIARARAERDQADAQLRLLRAGPRIEDIRQSEAQVAAARSEQSALLAELTAAQLDVDRFEALLASNSGSRKQRDDAVGRRDVVRERVQVARDRVTVAAETLARIRAGSRKEEIAAAEARVAAMDVQIRMFDKAVTDATVTAPISGTVTDVVVEVGELVPPRGPLVVLTDLDRAWANVYVDEPTIPRLRLGQDATLYTDAGGGGIVGRITFISPKAEFTPRNVQTAQDRSQLVYRIKIGVDNRAGTLKSGMPIEAVLPFQP